MRRGAIVYDWRSNGLGSPGKPEVLHQGTRFHPLAPVELETVHSREANGPSQSAVRRLGSELVPILVSSLLPPNATMWSIECPFNPDHGMAVHALVQIGDNKELLQTHTHCSCPIEDLEDFLNRQQRAEIYSGLVARVIAFPILLPERRN